MNRDEIKQFFKNDRFADLVGAQIESLSAEEVVCSLSIQPHHLNAGNKVQGGVLFTLADFAFAVACNYADLEKGNNNITVSHAAQIHYFKPASGDKLTVKTECLQQGRKLSVYRMRVWDAEGALVAEMTGDAYTVALTHP